MATQTPAAPESGVDTQQLTDALDRGLAAADAERAARLGQLVGVRTARTVVLQAERERLALVLAAGHPDVAALDQKILRNQDLGKLIRAESDRAKVEVERPAPPAAPPDKK